MALRLSLACISAIDGRTFLEQLVEDHYPSTLLVQRLGQGQALLIDGHLDDEAWSEVPWLDGFLDLAGPRYADRGTRTWQEASRAYAQRLTGSANPTRVKARWDSAYLYIGAELDSRHVGGSVTGHCDDLKSAVWPGTPVLPYFDDDFEVFINAAQNNYFYVEHEVNVRNATYSTLWSLPQAGLGSVAPECGGGGGARNVCCNTTWNAGQGLCDKGTEREAGSWTMEMYDRAKRPGSGMLSAAVSAADRWTVEMRFPILSSDEHGGLINLEPGSHYPGMDPTQLHPAKGQRYWWATFANALHAPWWSGLNASITTKEPELIKRQCEAVIDFDDGQNGFSQFLVDANNAAPTCYYEAASQNLGGHQYMHNPDNFGYLQFSEGSERVCTNVQWVGRFVLAQIYQAQISYLMDVSLGNGTYTAKLADLISPLACSILNACNSTALMLLADHVQITVDADAAAKTGACARYAVGDWQSSFWTGGPCFNASVAYTVRNKEQPAKSYRIVGTVNEARLIAFDPDVGQRWDGIDSDWLCLSDVALSASALYV